MLELIIAKHKAKLQYDKANKFLLAYCNNEYYDIEDRFKVWHEEVDKQHHNVALMFNSLNEAFKTPPPNCILDYDEYTDRFSRSTYFTYEDLISYVEWNIYDELDIEEPNESLTKMAMTSPDMIELKKWLMSENLGSWNV